MFRIETTENTLQLLSDVRRGQWFVHDHEALLPVALSFLRGEQISNTPHREAFEFSTTTPQFRTDGPAGAKKSDVAVIPIVGSITKYDSCFSYGAITYARAILAAAKHPDVGSIVLDIDSGGGAVNAIGILKEAIRQTKELGKPILAHVDLCASLAYWIASQCDAIFCDNALSEVGSIGGFCKIIDDTGALEMKGYKVITIYADESGDKNLFYRQALDGDYSLLKKDLSHNVALFHQDVKAGRPEIKDDSPGVFTGAMFYPEQAEELGLINGVMTLEACIENAAIRAKYNH